MRLLDERTIYYVYEHYKLGAKEPFWVGKGTGQRAYANGNKTGRNRFWLNVVNKYGYEIRFVAQNLNEVDAFWLENMCIVGWGRLDKKEGPLVNLTDGGEGGAGYIMPDYLKEQKRIAGIGRIVSEESRCKMRLARKKLKDLGIPSPHTGHKHSEKTKHDMRIKRKGIKHSLESNNKRRITQGTKIICNQTGIIYDSIRHAAKSCGISYGGIIKYLHLKGKQKTVKGLTFTINEGVV